MGLPIDNERIDATSHIIHAGVAGLLPAQIQAAKNIAQGVRNSKGAPAAILKVAAGLIFRIPKSLEK